MRLVLKVLTVFGLTIALLLPLAMIRGTVSERQRYRQEAVTEVARSTAGAQEVAGPVLLVPYRDRTVSKETDAKGVVRTIEKVRSGTLVFFPATQDVHGTIRSLPRMRGLHEVRVYELDATLRSFFNVRLPTADDVDVKRTFGVPRVGIRLEDVRGILGTPSLRVGGRPLPLYQGLGKDGVGGVHARLDAPRIGEILAFDAEFRTTLQGTESLSVMPLAAQNVITLDSAWPHPQFHGDFLPRTRTIGPDGFRARWEVSALASTAQARFRANLEQPGEARATEVVSVSLVDPVNVYTQVDRATKYGVLFVLLTFVAFFVFEFVRQLRIHPIQYGLVGLAVAIFFLLLLALSEHVRFWIAYLAAAVACVTLIGYYLGHVLGGAWRGTGFAAMLAALYAVLYALLISEDNAMVLGTALLFVILAGLMVLTRKVDWYRAALPSPVGP